jgi:hypothetical protein
VYISASNLTKMHKSQRRSAVVESHIEVLSF